MAAFAAEKERSDVHDSDRMVAGLGATRGSDTSDPLEQLADQIAVQDERSHVDELVRLRIRDIVLERDREELIETATGITQRLSVNELASIVADLRDGQVAI
jgi:hypothetical protein